jgi:hypothetical protein
MVCAVENHHVFHGRVAFRPLHNFRSLFCVA